MLRVVNGVPGIAQQAIAVEGVANRAAIPTIAGIDNGNREDELRDPICHELAQLCSQQSGTCPLTKLTLHIILH